MPPNAHIADLVLLNLSDFSQPNPDTQDEHTVDASWPRAVVWWRGLIDCSQPQADEHKPTWWSSAGEGKPAATLTQAACSQTGATETGTG